MGLGSDLAGDAATKLTEAVSRAPAGGKVNPFTSFQGTHAHESWLVERLESVELVGCYY
jgi:hypothetical protein